MKNQNLLLIEKLATEILDTSFRYCQNSDVHLSLDASTINNNAHNILKLLRNVEKEKV